MRHLVIKEMLTELNMSDRERFFIIELDSEGNEIHVSVTNKTLTVLVNGNVVKKFTSNNCAQSPRFLIEDIKEKYEKQNKVVREAQERFVKQWSSHIDEIGAISWQLMNTPEYKELQDIKTRLRELVVIASKGVKRIG